MKLNQKTAARAMTASIAMLALAACGGSADSAAPVKSAAIDGVTTVKVDEELRAELPSDVKKDGELTVGTNAPFAPYLMFKSTTDRTIIGAEPDIGHAIGNRLGIKLNFKQQPFPGLIPGLQSGKYDLVMATMFDSKEREKAVDLVNWSASGTAFLTAKGNPAGITTSASLCGNSAGVESGSFQQNLVKKFDAACDKAGSPGIDIKAYPQFSDALLSLKTSQVDAVIGNIPTMSYAQRLKANKDVFEVVIDPKFPQGYDSSSVGIALPKGSKLTPVLQKAVQSLIDDGSYAAILKKWSIEQTAVDTSTVNDAKN